MTCAEVCSLNSGKLMSVKIIASRLNCDSVRFKFELSEHESE
jgi:hypothetical protein